MNYFNDFEKSFADFLKKKSNALAKPDKSKKGSIDKEIEHILLTINSSDFYFTTSSCAGRLLVFKAPLKGRTKFNVEWLYSEHDLSKDIQFYIKATKEAEKIYLDSLNKDKEQVLWFKAEPPILHVASFNQNYAKEIIALAHKAGLKKSGLISFEKNLVEITSTEVVATPLFIGEKRISQLTEEFVSLSIEMVQKGREKFERFNQLFRNSLLK